MQTSMTSRINHLSRCLIKFDEDKINTFLKTPVVVEEGEKICASSRFALLRLDP